MIFIPIALVFLFLAGYLLYKNYLPQWQRQKAFEKNADLLPLFHECYPKVSIQTDHLSSEDIEKASKMALMFYCEKNWAQELDQKTKIIVSLTACLPLLNRSTNLYPSVNEIRAVHRLSTWLGHHELQFSVERSQTELKELKGSFIELGTLYFENPGQLKRQSEQAFKTLNSYFKFYSQQG